MDEGFEYMLERYAKELGGTLHHCDTAPGFLFTYLITLPNVGANFVISIQALPGVIPIASLTKRGLLN